MAISDLVFDIFAIDRASAVFDRVGASAETTGSRVDKGSKVMSAALLGAGAVAIGVGIKSLEMSANFDAAMTRLTTTAGESPAAMRMVSQGILQMAGQVGFTAQQLATAMYDVESGGFHGAAGLNILRDAAMGARIEGANVTDVAHALTGALNDYKGTTLTSAEATNAMTAAVGAGMMRFQDLAEAMPKIGARAAAAHVSFEEMLAAVATMTKDGLPASVAATYLGQSVGQLAAPTAKARVEMKGLGIDATAVAATITSGSGHGLGDAIQMLYDGIQRHLVGGGLVSVDTFKKMSKSTTDYQQVLAKLPPTIQTQVQALAVMTGGVRSFQGVLMLGGQHAGQYADTLKSVTDQVKKGGTAISGFSEVQKTLSFQFAATQGAASSLAVQIGHDLTPTAQEVLGVFKDFFGFLSGHTGDLETLGAIAIGAASALGALKLVTIGVSIAGAAATAMETGFAASTMAMGWAAVAAAAQEEGFAAAIVATGAAMETTPWGLIIGGAAAAAFGVYKLVQAFDSADPAQVGFNNALKQAREATGPTSQHIQSLADTYGHLTTQITAATFAMVQQDLDKAGALKAGQSLGLSTQTLVDAALGNVQAKKLVAEATAHATDMERSYQLQSITGLGVTQKQADMAAKAKAAYAQLHTSVGVLNVALGDENRSLKDATEAQKQAALSAAVSSGAFKGFRDSVHLLNEPIAQNAQQVALLAQKYHLSAGQIQTVLNAELVPTTVAAVQKIEASLNRLPSAAGSVGSQIGTNLAAGMQAGIDGMVGGVVASAAGIVSAAETAAKKQAGIKSPSTVWTQMGLYLVDGLVVGMTRGQHLAEEAAKQIAAGMHKSLMRGLRVEQLQLGFDLSAVQSQYKNVTAQIATATSWADAFKDNLFTASMTGIPTTSTTSIVNGMRVTQSGGLSGPGGIASALAYEKAQAAKNQGLAADIKHLRKLGLSGDLLSQMQQGGDQGIAMIQALSSANASQIALLNHYDSMSQSARADAGAYATVGTSMATLKRDQHNDARQIANIQRALRGLKLQIANDGHAVRLM